MNPSLTPTIRHLEGDLFEIESESESGRTYFMHAEAATCSCPHFLWRCKETPGKRCKHLELLAQVLAPAPCPYCRGAGLIYPRLRYATKNGGSTMEPLPCAPCMQTGRRDRLSAAELEAWYEFHPEERPEPLPSQDELKRLFA